MEITVKVNLIIHIKQCEESLAGASSNAVFLKERISSLNQEINGLSRVHDHMHGNVYHQSAGYAENAKQLKSLQEQVTITQKELQHNEESIPGLEREIARAKEQVAYVNEGSSILCLPPC